MKEKVANCKFDDACVCDSLRKICCEKCKWYFAVDSGYGYCTALPEHHIIPWCKDPCSLFK